MLTCSIFTLSRNRIFPEVEERECSEIHRLSAPIRRRFSFCLFLRSGAQRQSSKCSRSECLIRHSSRFGWHLWSSAVEASSFRDHSPTECAEAVFFGLGSWSTASTGSNFVNGEFRVWNCEFNGGLECQWELNWSLS